MTAQRREERGIDVPMTVTSLGADALASANITSTRELSIVAPGLNFTQNGGYTVITVRGVGSFQQSPGSENNVGLYLDGAIMPSKVAGIFELPDISSIEVLKGPQGTLWGRNATGGAVLINTRNPSFEAEGTITAGYGSFDDAYVRGFATAPVVEDKLAVSLAGAFQSRGAYLTNVVTGKKQGGMDSQLLRGKILFKPTETLELIFTGFYTRRMDRDQNSFSFPAGVTAGSTGFLTDPNAITTVEPRKFASRLTDTFWKNTTYSFSLNANLETDIGQFTSVSSYINTKSPAFIDGTFTSAEAVFYKTKQPEEAFSQALNFASERFGSLQVLAGVSYYWNTAGFQPLDVYFGPENATTPLITINYRSQRYALSGYLEGDLRITDKLTLVGGARYTLDSLKYFGSNTPGSYPFVAKDEWSRITPRVALRYAIDGNTNVYASYSQGFKGGSYDFSTMQTDAVEPETVDGFEIGLKSSSRLFSLAVSAFYQKYDNIQVETLSSEPVNPNIYFTTLVNAANARIYGLDLDLAVRPVEDLSLSLKLSPINAKFESFPGANVQYPTPLAQCPPASLPAGCGRIGIPTDVAGNDLRNAPRLSGSFAVDYVLHSSIGDIAFNTNLYFTEGFYWDVGNLYRQPGYALLGARVSWKPIENVQLSVWGKNLTNKDYMQAYNEVAGGAFWAMPRTVGVEATLSF